MLVLPGARPREMEMRKVPGRAARPREAQERVGRAAMGLLGAGGTPRKEGCRAGALGQQTESGDDPLGGDGRGRWREDHCGLQFEVTGEHILITDESFLHALRRRHRYHLFF